MFNCYELYTEQNFALDVEIQKLGKPHGPRPCTNVLHCELVTYPVTGRFTVTLIIHLWSTKIGKIDIFASYKPCKKETRKSNFAIDMVADVRRQGHDLCDTVTETPSMTMIHYNIGQTNLLFYSLSSTGQTTKYSVKIFKINFQDPGSEETESLCST